MDKALWKAASRIVRMERAATLFFVSLAVLIFPVVGWGFSNKPGVIASFFILGLGFVLAILQFCPIRKLPTRKQLTADNHVVLGIILTYLKEDVLGPKEKFVKSTTKTLKTIALDLVAYSKDAEQLSGSIKSNESGAELVVAQSALMRIRQIVPMLQERRAKLEEQTKQAEEMVKPVLEQIGLLQDHLNRALRDERVARSLKMVHEIDLRIPIDDAFLASLRQKAERTKSQLGDLVADSRALQAAWAEVRLESTLTVDDETHLQA